MPRPIGTHSVTFKPQGGGDRRGIERAPKGQLNAVHKQFFTWRRARMGWYEHFKVGHAHHNEITHARTSNPA